MLKIENNKLILSPELVMLLQAAPGDKISIQYLIRDNKTIPFILKNDTGNKLTNSLTVAFKGKQKETLLQFGDTFEEKIIDDSIELVGNKGTVIYAPVQKEITEEPIDKAIILDTNYNIQKFSLYEL